MKVVSIHLAEHRGKPTHSVDAVRAVPKHGLEGDRHFHHVPRRSKREITLIEKEAIDALVAEHDIELEYGEARRQIVTEGVSLNDLVGRRFRVGEVECEGTVLCDPCHHLEKLTHPGVQEGLSNRGGLCARILTEGTIRVGDPVVIEEEPAS